MFTFKPTYIFMMNFLLISRKSSFRDILGDGDSRNWGVRSIEKTYLSVHDHAAWHYELGNCYIFYISTKPCFETDYVYLLPNTKIIYNFQWQFINIAVLIFIE